MEFPRERRDALWAVHERVRRRRGQLLLWHLVKRLVPGMLARRANRLSGYLAQEYAKVLTAEELAQFLSE
jgi:hypothetical protein